MNPLAQMIGADVPGKLNPQAVQQAKQMMNVFRTMKNPEAMLSQNPQFSAVMQMCQGRNPKDVFYEQCNKMGVNPDEIIKMLQ